MDKNKNAIIGVFVLTAIGIITYIILFLHPSSGDQGQTLRVRFANIDKVNIGTRVLFAGHPVGEVLSMEEVEGARDQGFITDDEDVYIYELTLKIDSAIKVYMSDDVSVMTSGLLGEKSVEITPRPPPKDGILIPTGNKVMYASSPGSVETAVKMFSELAEKGKGLVQQISDQVAILEKDGFAYHLAKVAKNISEISTAINRPEDLSNIVANVNSISFRGQEMMKNIQDGKGTMGQIVSSDDLYLRFTSVMNKADTVMDDINHYGLLFQNDSSWQRMRARRTNLLYKLQTPQEFQNFFNDEVNQVATSLSRLYQVMNESQRNHYYDILCEPEFVRVFSDFLQRVQGLEDDLKLYNTQVVELRDKYCKPPYR